MNIAKICYLTSPGEGRYVLNFQEFGSQDVFQIEVPAETFRNVLSDGVRLMLNSSFHRVPVNKQEGAQ